MIAHVFDHGDVSSLALTAMGKIAARENEAMISDDKEESKMPVKEEPSPAAKRMPLGARRALYLLSGDRFRKDSLTARRNGFQPHKWEKSFDWLIKRKLAQEHTAGWVRITSAGFKALEEISR